MNHDEEAIDMNPLGHIIVSIASFATIAMNGTAASIASFTYSEVKCFGWYC